MLEMYFLECLFSRSSLIYCHEQQQGFSHLSEQQCKNWNQPKYQESELSLSKPKYWDKELKFISLFFILIPKMGFYLHLVWHTTYATSERMTDEHTASK